MKRDLPSECSGCGLEERWLLHHVNVRHSYNRLCTSCVLKLHSGSFCPICFEVYEGSRLPPDRVMCSRCPSVTHPDCVSKDVASSFVCPPCSNPNFTFFDTSRSPGSEGNSRCIDEKMAKILVAAAQIAWISMSKAASSARMDSDRKVKEAALKRKEAKEALQKLSVLVTKKGKQIMIYEQPVPISTMMPEAKKSIRVNPALSAAVVAQKRFENQALSSFPAVGNKEKVEGSSKSGLETQQGKNLKKIGCLPPTQNNVVVHEKEKNGLVLNSTESSKLQHAQSRPNAEAQGNPKGHTESRMGQLMPQPNRVDNVGKSDLFAKKANGVLPGSSNTPS